jgi:hypothetical protein
VFTVTLLRNFFEDTIGISITTSLQNVTGEQLEIFKRDDRLGTIRTTPIFWNRSEKSI